MRFMMLVKHGEKQGPPPQELMDAMAILHQEAIKAGTIPALKIGTSWRFRRTDILALWDRAA